MQKACIEFLAEQSSKKNRTNITGYKDAFEACYSAKAWDQLRQNKDTVVGYSGANHQKSYLWRSHHSVWSQYNLLVNEYQSSWSEKERATFLNNPCPPTALRGCRLFSSAQFCGATLFDLNSLFSSFFFMICWKLIFRQSSALELTWNIWKN